MIEDKDISIIICGPIVLNTIKKCIESIKKYFPNSKIILSTWENSDVTGVIVDKFIFNKDPQSFLCSKTAEFYTNINRQLTTIKSALREVDTKYVIKIRSDLYFTNNSFVAYLNQFSQRNTKYSFFSNRVIISSLFSKIYSDDPKTPYPLPFHISDFLMFGYSKDVKSYYLDTELIEDEKLFSDYTCKYPEKIPISAYSWKMAPEQYFCFQWVSRNIFAKFEDWSDWNDNNILLAEKIYANNFIILDVIQHGIYCDKYKDWININNGNTFAFQGFANYLYFLELYKKYCDCNIKIPSQLYYIRDEKYNKYYRKLQSKKNIVNIIKFICRKQYVKMSRINIGVEND